MRGSNTISSLSQHHGEAILASSYDVSGNSLLQHHGNGIKHPYGIHSIIYYQSVQELPMLLQSLGHHDPGIKSNGNSLLFGHDEATLSLSYGMRGSDTTSSLSQHHGEALLASSYDIPGNSLLQHHGQGIQHPYGNHSSTVLPCHDGITLSSSCGFYSTNYYYKLKSTCMV